MLKVQRPIGVGLVGCGHVAQRAHLPALRHVPGARVIAAVDLNRDLLEWVADQFAIPRRYPDVEALLSDSEVEAVAVLVPATEKSEVASKVLDAGKHLLLEKPLALSLKEGERLIQRAKASSCTTLIGYNLRWHRLIRQATTIVRQGRIGSIKMVRTNFALGKRLPSDRPMWRDHRDLGGGTLFEVAPHHVDLWRFLLQSEVDEIFATTQSVEADDDVVILTARMDNGVQVSSSFIERTGSAHSLGVSGSDGHLEVSLYRFDGLRHFPISARPGDPRTRLWGVVHTLKELPFGLLMRGRGMNDYKASFQLMWEHFFECIRQNKDPECTFLDGQQALEIIHAAAESASNGVPVKIALTSSSALRKEALLRARELSTKNP